MIKYCIIKTSQSYHKDIAMSLNHCLQDHRLSENRWVDEYLVHLLKLIGQVNQYPIVYKLAVTL